MTGSRPQEYLGTGRSDPDTEDTAGGNLTTLGIRLRNGFRFGTRRQCTMWPPIHERVFAVITSGESGHDAAELALEGIPICTSRTCPDFRNPAANSPPPASSWVVGPNHSGNLGQKTAWGGRGQTPLRVSVSKTVNRV